jgi:hypothetical protein
VISIPCSKPQRDYKLSISSISNILVPNTSVLGVRVRVRHIVVSRISDVASNIACPFWVLHCRRTPIAVLFIHTCCSQRWEYIVLHLLKGLDTFAAYKSNNPQPTISNKCSIIIYMDQIHFFNHYNAQIVLHYVSIVPQKQSVHFSRIL